MDFKFTEEQEFFRTQVKDAVDRLIRPKTREIDEADEFPTDLWKQFAGLGYLGLRHPEKYGGLGLDYISLGLASEEMEYGDTSARVVLSVHIGLYSLPLCTWGTEAQKEKYLIPCTSG